MKQGIIIQIDWELIGAHLAQVSDDEQIKFFKSFIKECFSWGTHYQVKLQLAAVNSKLTNEEREILKMLSYTEDN